jgi:hypothetical protein
MGSSLLLQNEKKFEPTIHTTANEDIFQVGAHAYENAPFISNQRAQKMRAKMQITDGWPLKMFLKLQKYACGKACM